MAYRYRRRDPETGAMELYEDAGRSIPVDFGGMNLTGTPNLDYLQNLANLAQQQQGPQLGPDEFGSYSIPMSDPTYRSGFDYARSIAGGMPMSQVIAPGVSYSPEQPMGYTQEQLNTAVGTTPVEPPQGTSSPYGVFADDPRYFGTGIGGVTIFDDKDPKAIEHRDIITGKIIGGPPRDNLQGRDFSIDREPLPPQDFGFGPGIRPTEIIGSDGRIIAGSAGVTPPDFVKNIENKGPGSLRDRINVDRFVPPKSDDFMSIGGPGSGVPDPRFDSFTTPDIGMPPPPLPPQDFGYGPGIMPPLPPMDIDKLIPPVDLPLINIPPRIPLDLPIVRPPTIMDKPRTIDRQTIMDELTGGRFSINQQRPMGLF